MSSACAEGINGGIVRLPYGGRGSTASGGGDAGAARSWGGEQVRGGVRSPALPQRDRPTSPTSVQLR